MNSAVFGQHTMSWRTFCHLQVFSESFLISKEKFSDLERKEEARCVTTPDGPPRSRRQPEEVGTGPDLKLLLAIRSRELRAA